MRSDIRELEKRVNEIARRPPIESWHDEEITSAGISKVPAPFRGVGYVLGLLPPGARIFGLLVIGALVALGIVYGVKLI